MPVIPPAPTAVAAFVGWFPEGPMNRAVEVESFRDVEVKFGGLHAGSEASFGLWQFFRNGGTRAWVVGTGIEEEDAASGLPALNGTDFSLLCLPRLVSNAVEYCRERQAMLLLDPPASLTAPVELVAWLYGNSPVRDEHVAMYFPAVIVADPTSGGRPRRVGPSGTVAGLMATTDAAHGVWSAPAGTDAALRGIVGLDYVVTDAHAGILTAAGVNCLREIPGYGPVCWGARTLFKPEFASSPYRYLHARRLANFVASSVTAGLSWAVFEPNDEHLWSAIRRAVEDFLLKLHGNGAFAGAAPAQAYFVRCDATTTTAAHLELGVVGVVVGFAPLRPAEFVELRVEQLVGQPNEEAVG